MLGLGDYNEKSKEKLITATRNNTGSIMTRKQHRLGDKMGRKTTVWIFQAINWRNRTREDLDMVTKEKSSRKIDSLLIAAENKAINTNYIKAKIDNTLHIGYMVTKIDNT